MLKSASNVSWRNYKQTHKSSRWRGIMKIWLHRGVHRNTCFHLYFYARHFHKLAEKGKLKIICWKTMFSWLSIHPYHPKIGKKKVRNHTWYLKKFNLHMVDEQNVFQNSVSTVNGIMQFLKTDVSEHKPDKQLSLMPNKSSSAALSWAVKKQKVQSILLSTAAQAQTQKFKEECTCRHGTPSTQPSAPALHLRVSIPAPRKSSLAMLTCATRE